jgi:hypothetical protein
MFQSWAHVAASVGDKASPVPTDVILIKALILFIFLSHLTDDL